MNTNATFIQRIALPIYLLLTPLISLAIALFLPVPVLVIALLLLLVPSTLAILLTGLALGTELPSVWPIPIIATGIWIVIMVAVALRARRILNGTEEYCKNKRRFDNEHNYLSRQTISHCRLLYHDLHLD